MAPKGLISCRRAENIHGSLKSGQVHPFLRLFRGGVTPNGHSKYTPSPLSFFFLPARGNDPLIRAKLYIYFFPSAEKSYKNSASNPLRKRRPLSPYTLHLPRVTNDQSSSSGYFGSIQFRVGGLEIFKAKITFIRY